MFRNQEMFAVSNDQTNRKNNFQKIKDQVESIKMILRCGIWFLFLSEILNSILRNIWLNTMHKGVGYMNQIILIEAICHC